MSDTDILRYRVEVNHVLEELRGPRSTRRDVGELRDLLTSLRDATDAALARI